MPGFPGLTLGLNSRIDVIPWDKNSELQVHHRHQLKFDPNNLRIAPSLHPGALIGIGRGRDMLPGPQSHIVRGPQR